MTVLGIVRKYLEENGYDGLVQKEAECGCGLDDLAPCSNGEGDFINCEPGYKVPCTCGEGCPFHIATEKQEALK